jgi:hypothetical protein
MRAPGTSLQRTRVYLTLTAQVATSAAPAINGTYVHRTQYRLGQNVMSTRILLFMVAAFFASPGTQGIVLHCPGSVAAVASLGRTEAEGGDVPEGAEWWEDREVRRRGVFEVPGGFTLGWRDVQTQSSSSSSDGSEGGVARNRHTEGLVRARRGLT